MDISILFKEAKLKKITMKNRLVMAPMTTVSGELDGSFSDQEIQYLSQRAQDGIGTIITPACYCHKSGHAFERQVGCDNDSLIDSLARTAEAINKHGAVSFLQIHHGGNASKEIYTNQKPLAPSACKNRSGTSELPKAMSEDEILLIIDSFAKAAGRAKKAGFSGIELHGANTYLLQQFFSPFTNKRKDQWGDNVILPGRNRLENRSRFVREILKAVRAEVGENYPIAYRISPEEADPFGYSTKDTIDFLKIIVPFGIDIIHVSSWSYHKNLRNDMSSATNPTYMIKSALPYMPIIGVGGISLPQQAVEVLEQGIEFVALGKILMLEKNWVQKVKNGDINKIRTTVCSKKEISELDIPDRMKKYAEKFFLNK